MGGDSSDDRDTYSSSWSLVLPGGTRFDIGLIPSMAVENLYREWARAAVASASNNKSNASNNNSSSSGDTRASGTASSPAVPVDGQSMHSFFLPLSLAQIAELRQWALAETGTSKIDAALKTAEALVKDTDMRGSGGVVLSKLMVDYATGTGQLLLPPEVLGPVGVTAGATTATATSMLPSPSAGPDAQAAAHAFVFLADSAPLSLQRDGIAVGPGAPPADFFTTPASKRVADAPQSMTPSSANTLVSTGAVAATASHGRGSRGRQKVVWSWEGAGRLHAYPNAVSKRLEESYVNYLCLLREAAQKDSGTGAVATADAAKDAVAAVDASGAVAASTTTTTTTAVPSTFPVRVRAMPYDMDYAAMTQRNPTTGRTRNIKREGPAPLLPAPQQRPSTASAVASDPVADPVSHPAAATTPPPPPPPPSQTPQELAKKLLPGKWQFMRARGRKWYDFEAADNKGVEEAYQNFIVQFRTGSTTKPLVQSTDTATTAKATTTAATVPSDTSLSGTPPSSVGHTGVPRKHVTRADMITHTFVFDGLQGCETVSNEHKEPFESCLQYMNDTRVTLIRLLYSTQKAQFVLAVATWEALAPTVTANVATLPGKGTGQLEEEVTELGTDGRAAADAFTERVTEAMCEAAALSGGINANQSMRRLLPNSGVVKGATCGTENFTYTFDFIRMTQKNEQTNRSRRIRRLTEAMPVVDGHYTAKPPLPATAASSASAVPPKAQDAAVGTGTAAATTTTTAAVADGDAKKTAPKLILDKCIHNRDQWDPVQVNGEFYYCMLNQANVASNANKFYCIQLLKDKKSGRYAVYTRYGRVGDNGSSGFVCSDSSLDWAVKRFEEQFQKKAHVKWSDREKVKPKAGRYIFMKIDLSAADDDDKNKDGQGGSSTVKLADFNPMTPVNAPPSKLHPLVRDLMTFISDRSDMSDVLQRDFSLDVKKMPLGNITKEQIKDALSVLSQIDDILRNPLELSPQKKLTDLSNVFYTLVPHRVSKQERLPIIGDVRLLHKKVQLMQNLGDMEIASDLLKKVEEAGKNMVEHPLDTMYKRLQCQLTPLDDADPIVQRIRHYVNQTRGKTHHNIPEVEEVFAVGREGEDARYDAFLEKYKGQPGAPDTNRVMLWHGSRKTNFLGILSKGLRIAPPEAPSTGYMFGKGIYFSDVVTKASNYCFSRDKKGLILLNEVALGKCFELGQSKFMLKPQTGTFSTHGVGGSAPDVSGYQTFDKVMWPMGKTHEVKHPRIQKTSLLYPEFIIYDEAQYRMRYLLRIRFK